MKERREKEKTPGTWVILSIRDYNCNDKPVLIRGVNTVQICIKETIEKKRETQKQR